MKTKPPVIAVLDIGSEKYKLILASCDLNGQLVFLETCVDFFDGIDEGDTEGPKRFAMACNTQVKNLEIKHRITIEDLLISTTGSYLEAKRNTITVPVETVENPSHRALRDQIQTHIGERLDSDQHSFNFHVINEQDKSASIEDETKKNLQTKIDYIAFVQDSIAFSFIQALLNIRAWGEVTVDYGNRYLIDLLPEPDKQKTCVCIDVGGAITVISIYTKGILTSIKFLMVGGDHITNDIAICMKLDKSKAERLKRYGVALTQPNIDRIKRKLKLVMENETPLDLDLLQDIARARIDEWSDWINRILDNEGLNWKNTPVYLFGKGFKISGICDYLTSKNYPLSFPKFSCSDRFYRRDNFISGYAMLMAYKDKYVSKHLKVNNKNKKGILGKMWSVLVD